MSLQWHGVSQRKITSDDSAARPWQFECPELDCYFAVSALSFEDAKQKELKHQKQGNCPVTGTIHIGGIVTLTLVEQMWEKMDIAFLELKAQEAAFGTDDIDTARLRGKLRGMAEMTAIFMPPRFRTADEIAKEVYNRWKHKEANEEYETPGLGSRRYEPPVQAVTYGTGRKTSSRTVVEAPLPFTEVSDQEKQQIRFAMSSGAFTAEQIATTYQITVKQVTEIASG